MNIYFEKIKRRRPKKTKTNVSNEVKITSFAAAHENRRQPSDSRKKEGTGHILF